MSKILLFGGTFDPVHNGHVALLECAIEAIRPDKVGVIPVGNPWQRGRLPFAPGASRCAMLRLAFPHATIDERELRREGPTYTVDTLRAIAVAHPKTSLIWLLGTDSFARLDTWHEAGALAGLASFAVVRRAAEAVVAPTGNFQYQVVDCAPPAVSSTGIRELRRRGVSIRELVPAAVCDYIQQHQLYAGL